MKTLHFDPNEPHLTFPVLAPDGGEYEVDAFFSADGRLTELCIAGENGAAVDERVCRSAVLTATGIGQQIKAAAAGRAVDA
jgi:hypothetical protein